MAEERGRRAGGEEAAYLSSNHIVEPLEQLNHSALATSTGTHQCNYLPNFHCQSEIIQNLYVQSGFKNLVKHQRG